MKKALVLPVLAFVCAIPAFGQTYVINHTGGSQRDFISMTRDADGSIAVSGVSGGTLVTESRDGNTTTTADPDGAWEVIVTEGNGASRAASNGSRNTALINGQRSAEVSANGDRIAIKRRNYTVYINRIAGDWEDN